MRAVSACVYCQARSPGQVAPVHLHAWRTEGFLRTYYWSDGSITYRNWHGATIEGLCF